MDSIPFSSFCNLDEFDLNLVLNPLCRTREMLTVSYFVACFKDEAFFIRKLHAEVVTMYSSLSRRRCSHELNFHAVRWIDRRLGESSRLDLIVTILHSILPTFST